MEAIAEFRPCVGIGGYEVSKTGDVRNLKTGYVLKHTLHNGYLTVCLHRRRYFVHRLVAEAWLPPPEPGLTEVNHRDREKKNCHVSNLEWVTPGSNKKHARETAPKYRQRRGQAIESIDEEGRIVRSYCSMADAARDLGVCANAVFKALDNPTRTCKGLHWRSSVPMELPGEEWRDLCGHFELTFAHPYAVSSLGRMRGPRGLMYASPGTDGYLRQYLQHLTDGETIEMAMRIHRIIATVFLGPAPSKRHVVDHIDKNRSNNAVSNLRWATPQENTIFALGRPVIQLSNDCGAVITHFDSMTLAARAVKRSPSSIHQAIETGGTSACNRWAYA